jgi:hypothetical protein
MKGEGGKLGGAVSSPHPPASPYPRNLARLAFPIDTGEPAMTFEIEVGARR